jgi:cysteinyl-tRNA synthetase, unknown class
VRTGTLIGLGTGWLVLLASLLASGRDAAPASRRQRGVRANAPWVSFYGNARQMGDLRRVAAAFRLINIDADPGTANFSRADIATLRAGGRNTVVSYLNLGACERDRSYWRNAPPGLISCGANHAAQIGPYRHYDKELWMDPGNADYRRLLVEHVAPRLAATGVDGFFLDNLEIIEHGAHDAEAPCGTSCVQGALMLVEELRHKFPDHVIIMQNATSRATRVARVGEVTFASLIDGVSREEIYAPRYDREAEAELLAWQQLALAPNGRPFSITTEDYVGGCGQTTRARKVFAKSRGRGFSPYATISSADQDLVCFWPF